MEQESGATPHRAPRRFPRSLFIVSFGPLVGAVVMFVVMTGLSSLWSEPDVWEHIGYAAFVYISFGWVAGILPAVASAVMWRFLVPKRWSLAKKAVAAALVGAVSGALFIWPFTAMVFGSYAPNIVFNLLAGLCGSIALLATALPFAERD